MNINRVKGILLQEYFITIHSLEIFFDLVVNPLTSIIIFGFLSTFIAGSTRSSLGQTLLMGMLLWQIIFVIQYSISVGSLWNIWSRNLTNMFVAPITIAEYICAYTLSGILKSLIIFSLTSTLIRFSFGFGILVLGLPNLILFIASLLLFAFAMGVIILGLIFRFGAKIQSIAWGILPIIQPLSAALYPIHVLPKFLQYFAYLLPPTYVFESARQVLNDHTMNWSMMEIGFIVNIIYVLFAIWFFNFMFRRAKETGQFARNEG